MKISEVLNEAPKWIKGVYATDDQGRTCGEHSSQACHFCLAGAMLNAGISAEEFPKIASIIIKLFPRRVRRDHPLGGETVITIFNDYRRTTFADIRKVIRAYENL